MIQIEPVEQRGTAAPLVAADHAVPVAVEADKQIIAIAMPAITVFVVTVVAPLVIPVVSLVPVVPPLLVPSLTAFAVIVVSEDSRRRDDEETEEEPRRYLASSHLPSCSTAQLHGRSKRAATRVPGITPALKVVTRPAVNG